MVVDRVRFGLSWGVLGQYGTVMSYMFTKVYRLEC